MAIFNQNHGLTPLKKPQFFDCFFFFFYSLESSFFALEYRKTHFPGLYCLKKNDGKMAIFGRKAWTKTPLKKSQFFDFFNSLFL